MVSFAIIFFALLIGFIGLIIWVIASAVSKNKRIENAPVVRTRAVVVAKRTHTGGAGVYGATGTDCFATFEFGAGERREFRLHPDFYGLLAENDTGTLAFQDIVFIGFDRDMTPENE